MPLSTLRPAPRTIRVPRGTLAIIVILVSTLLLGGCLMVEHKEYVFNVRPDGTGSGRITFENFTSLKDNKDGEDQTTKDYTELINKFLKGNELEVQNPAYQNVRKRLFEKDGKLFGEITFDFASFEDVGLFRLDGKGTWMYYSGQLNGATMESLDSTTGRYGGERMPVIFWPEGTSEFRLRTSIETPEEDASSQSLLPLFKRIGTE